MDNPLSKTHFVATKDRLQHYSNDTYACTDCNNQYNPKVHSQPYFMQFGVIILGIGGGFAFLSHPPIWLYIAVAGIVIPYVYFYAQKERKISSGKPKYGEIILECPKCGSAHAIKNL